MRHKNQYSLYQMILIEFNWQITEEEVLEVLERVLVNNNSSPVSKQYCINAIVKLSTRFNSHKWVKNSFIYTHRCPHSAKTIHVGNQNLHVIYTAGFIHVMENLEKYFCHGMSWKGHGILFWKKCMNPDYTRKTCNCACHMRTT